MSGAYREGPSTRRPVNPDWYATTPAAEAWERRAEAAEARVAELEHALGRCEYEVREIAPDRAALALRNIAAVCRDYLKGQTDYYGRPLTDQEKANVQAAEKGESLDR